MAQVSSLLSVIISELPTKINVILCLSYSLLTVVFDPASFYGHHEYELAIAGMFGGFTASFYEAYHSHFPRAHGFDSRHKLYQLFHYLNHW